MAQGPRDSERKTRKNEKDIRPVTSTLGLREAFNPKPSQANPTGLIILGLALDRRLTTQSQFVNPPVVENINQMSMIK